MIPPLKMERLKNFQVLISYVDIVPGVKNRIVNVCLFIYMFFLCLPLLRMA